MSILRTSDGKMYPRIRVPGSERCDVCGSEGGGYHTGKCDQEPCPRCGNELLTCDCVFVTFKHESFDDFEKVCEFALDKDVISIIINGSKIVVFYWG